MIKCHNCQKDYKKNGLTRHLSYCLKKKILNSEKKEIKPSEIITNNYFDRMPDDIMLIIHSYIIENSSKIDKFTPIASYYKNIIDISLISKRFYFLFSYNFFAEELKKSIISSIKEQNDKNICKKTAKSIYPLKDIELENDIQYKLVKNPYYRCAAPMKIYREIDILNFLRSKYGSYTQYLKLIVMNDIERKKRTDKKKELEIKRKIKYDALFKKYNLLPIDNNNNSNTLYDKYYDYIVNIRPSFSIIEKEVISKYEYNLRYDRVNKYILENNLQKMKSKIVDDYIENNSYEFESAMMDITNKNKRRIELCNLIADNNIFYTQLNEYEKKCADDYIYQYNIVSLKDDLIDTVNKIKNIIIRRNTITDIFKYQNIQNIQNHIKPYENKKIENYIEKGIYTLNEIYEIFSNITERIQRTNNINMRLLKECADTKLNDKEELMVYNYINKNEPCIDKIIEVILSKNTRKIELIKRFNEVGIKLQNNLEICEQYIQYGNMTLDSVINIMLEINFYYTCTNYSNLCYYKLTYNSLTYNKKAEKAKERALMDYIKKFETYEDVLLDSSIPPSLYDHIKIIFDTNISIKNKINNKCKCNNVPSPVCGHCSICCEGCSRHIITII